MQINSKLLGKWIAAAAFVALATASQAAPVVIFTYDFEGPSLDGWISSGTEVQAVSDSNAHGGTGTIRNSDEDGGGTLSRSDFSFIELRSYAVDFFFKGDGGIELRLNGKLLQPTEDDDGTSYVNYFYDFEGKSGSSSLEFTFTGTRSFLDDITITDKGCTNDPEAVDCLPTTGGNGNGVPEPGSLLLVGAALAGLGLVRRRKPA